MGLKYHNENNANLKYLKAHENCVLLLLMMDCIGETIYCDKKTLSRIRTM